MSVVRRFSLCVLYVSLVCALLPSADAAATNGTISSPDQDPKQKEAAAAQKEADLAYKKTVVKVLGIGAGAAIGCTAGGSIGSVIPVVGTAVGCIGGGIVGGLGVSGLIHTVIIKD